MIAEYVLAAAALAFLVALVMSRTHAARLVRSLRERVSLLQAELNAARAADDAHRTESAKALAAARDGYDRALADLRESQREALGIQIETLRSGIAADGAQMQRQREQSLRDEAHRTFSDLSESLSTDLRLMRESFEAQRKAQIEGTAAMRADLEATARALGKQSEAVGRNAESLAIALRGQNKMQGCWGETLFENILISEGFERGRDYDREVTIRDVSGHPVANSVTGERMRPDFILHYPDSTDIIVDSKVSLTALSDYFSSDDEQGRAAAAARNLESVLAQIRLLSSKEYQAHACGSRRTLDFVIMFIPNAGALELARTLDPAVFSRAFSQGVLLATSETVMPLLRIIRTAWTDYLQVANVRRIVEHATRMVDRVAEFARDYALVGRRLREAEEAYRKGGLRLSESGASIVHSAREVIRLGVAPTREESRALLDGMAAPEPFPQPAGDRKADES